MSLQSVSQTSPPSRGALAAGAIADETDSIAEAQAANGQRRAGAEGVAALNLAARLMAEAAHDIKSPLSGIREMLVLVAAGELGPVNEIQQSTLSDLVEQCEAMFHLVENMLDLNRLRSGMPATRRQWIVPSSIPVSVHGVLGGIASIRQVAIRWDGFDGGRGPIYGDAALLRRLLINLVGNAVAVSPEQSTVMISLRPSATPGMLRLVVSDAGPGMTASKIQQMAVRGASDTGSTGLGLAIGRALAALHFGRLLVTSRPGIGTRIGLELPAGGPASVAGAFSRWREGFAATPDRISQELRIDQAEEVAGAGSRRMSSEEVAIDFDGTPPRYHASFCAVGLRTSAKVQPSVADGIDEIVQADQRVHELVYRTDSRRWVFMWDNNVDEAARRSAGMDRLLQERAGATELVWSPPVEQSIGRRSDRGMVSEMLVRDALHASSRLPMMDDRQGRSMRERLPATQEVSARRLDEELRRLSPLLHRQSKRLQQQAQILSQSMGEGT